MEGQNSTFTRTEFVVESEQELNEYPKHRGCFVSTKKAILLAVFAILCLLAVGTLIYVYGSKKYTKVQNDDIEYSLNETLTNLKSEEFRLSTQLQPLHYRLRIHPYLDESDPNNFSFTGEVTIAIQCKVATKSIIVHVDELQVIKSDVKVTTRKDIPIRTGYELSSGFDVFEKEENISTHTTARNSNKIVDNPRLIDFGMSNNSSSANVKYYTSFVPKTVIIDIKSIEVVNKTSKFIINLFYDLKIGGNYTVNIKFSGKVSNNLLGLYRSSYFDEHGNKRWILNTHLQPVFARRIFPCFDEPLFKAAFEISVARKTSMTSISNMPLKESEKMKNKPGWVWDHFDISPPMPPHLVAFAVFDYEYIKPNVSEVGLVFKIWAPKHLLANAQYAVNIIPKILSYLESYCGVQFPLSKVDLVVVPELYQTAVENWGLITFRENALLLNSSNDSWKMKNFIFKTITGKLTKQWFGGMVTMEWWSDLWLSEGFSIYMEDLVENTLDPTLELTDTFSVRTINTVLDSDILKSIQSLRVNIKDPMQIEQLFDDIKINKGSSLIRMLNITIGEDAFKRGIQKYLKTKSKYATLDTFWNSFSDIHNNKSVLPDDVSIKDFMNTWIIQDGYPIVSVIRNYEDDSVTISQKGFVNFHHINDNLWHIPLTYSLQSTSNISNRIWMKNVKVVTIKNLTTNPDEWIDFNLEGKGLYRVNYDSKNWNLLKNQLMSNPLKISAIDRGQLLNDAFELSNIGMVNYTTAFELSNYLRHEENNIIPWYFFFNSLKPMVYIIQRTRYLGIFEEYVLNLVEPLYNKLGHNELPNETQNMKLLRYLIIQKACEYNHVPCLEWSWKQFKMWMLTSNPDSENPIAQEFREVVLCSAIKVGGKHEWNFLWERTLYPFVSTSNLKLFYYCLGCTRQPWIIIRYLEKSLSGNITLQNSKLVWKSLVHAVGLNVGFSYLRSNWNKIFKRSEHLYSNLNAIFEEFLSKLSTKVDLEDLTTFYKSNKKRLLSVSSLMLSIVEKIKWRVNWVDANMKIVVKCMEDNVN